MTVMLLQRSATPQLTPSQKTAPSERESGRASAEGEQPPFLILLDIQEHAEPLEREAAAYDGYNGGGGGGQTKFTGGYGAAVGGGQLQLLQQTQNPAAGGLAMRYYRLWIYACNLVLLCSAVGFAAAVSHTLLFSGDLRRYLVPGVPRAHDPSALYAYLAFAVQLGLVQLLGCVAARRLSVRLLNAYWLILLALLAGDAVLGIAWVFRFERMRAELRPSLRLRLQAEYGKDARFSEQWDQLQREYKCCGVTGPLDFGPYWPDGCCPEAQPVSLGLEGWRGNASEAAPTTPPAGNATSSSPEPCQNPTTRGCEAPLREWLRQTADLLFVLGFCVIAFTKLCFIGILRYEIREMIQKIRLMREPPPSTVPFIQSLGLAPQPPQPPPGPQPPAQPLVEVPLNNGAIANRRTTLPIVSAHANAAGTTSLYVPGDESSKHPLLQQDGGADSDTNSHCALILEESTPPAQHHATAASAALQKSNGNYEMREFNCRLLFSSTSAAPGSTPGAQPVQPAPQTQRHT